MGQLWVRDDKKPARTPVSAEARLSKVIASKDYEVKRVRHEADDWRHVAEELGHKKIVLMKLLGDEKRHRLYERIGWLLLSISLVLAHHL